MSKPPSSTVGSLKERFSFKHKKKPREETRPPRMPAKQYSGFIFCYYLVLEWLSGYGKRQWCTKTAHLTVYSGAVCPATVTHEERLKMWFIRDTLSAHSKSLIGSFKVPCKLNVFLTCSPTQSWCVTDPYSIFILLKYVSSF